MRTITFSWCLAAATLTAVAAAAQDHYRLESAVVLPAAAPAWDYLSLDAERGHLFIGRRDDGVTVFDVRANRVVGAIADSNGANMATLVPEFDRGYTTNGDGSSTIFTLSTLKTVSRFKFGDDADAAYYEPVTKQLAFMMGDSKLITFVDAKTGRVTGKLSLDSEKIESGAPDGDGNMLVALRDKNQIVKIDLRSRRLTTTWDTVGCMQPTGVAIDRVQRRLFVGCRGTVPVLAVINIDSGAVVTTLPIGRGNDGVVYDPQTHRIYASNGVDANLVIFDRTGADTYKLVEAVTTRPTARTMALDPATKKVFTVAAEGRVDPAKPVNTATSPFYPNVFFADTFTLLTYAPH